MSRATTIVMRKVKDEGKGGGLMETGDFFIEGNKYQKRLHVAVPDDNGQRKWAHAVIWLYVDEHPHEGPPLWEWDHNEEKPSLKNSVVVKTSQGWHGFIRGGLLVDAAADQNGKLLKEWS